MLMRKMQGKRITVLGWYGSGNTGDEAILRSILNMIRKASPDSFITVLSIDPHHTTLLHNVHSISIYDKSSTFNLLSKTNLLILGGGGILKPNSAYLYSTLLLLSKLFGAKTMTLSIGAAPILSKMEKLITRLSLNLCDIISVRDEESKKVLHTMGILKPINVTSDVTFAIDLLDIKNSFPEELNLVSRPYVVLCLRNWYHEDLIQSGVYKSIDFSNFLKIIGRLCDTIIENGLDVLFVPMKTNGHDSDVENQRLLIKRIKHSNNVYSLNRNLSFEEVITVLKFAQLVIGMRLHSLIFSTLTLTPIVALSYAQKVKNYMESIGLEHYCIDLKHLNERELVDVFLSAYNKRENLKEKLKEVVEVQRTKALINEKLIASLLSS